MSTKGSPLNFNRTPTPGENDGIPAIAPYHRDAPDYLAFRTQGPVVVKNYLGMYFITFRFFILFKYVTKHLL